MTGFLSAVYWLCQSHPATFAQGVAGRRSGIRHSRRHGRFLGRAAHRDRHAQLDAGIVELHFDDETKTCNIVPAGDADE